VAFCGYVRCCGCCSFGGGDVPVADVEGSTRRWENDPDEMRLALAAHDEVLRSVIEAHGGWLFKHTGDGVCAAFASPRSAVDAAVAAQRVLALPVRMGIATGEAELRGADWRIWDARAGNAQDLVRALLRRITFAASRRMSSRAIQAPAINDRASAGPTTRS
jgi:hypothetical protein